jgi:hypothetical protein
VGRQYVDRGPVNKRRPDLVTALGMKAPATAGFQRRFPIPRGSSPSLDELRVVAVWGQRYAFELPRRPWYLVSEGNRHSPDYLLTFDRELLIRRNPREGAVLEVRVSSRDVRMSGWTAAPTYGRPVRLVVLNRGRLLWEGSPQFAASDWTADDDGLVRTGFAMSFSLPHLPVAPEFRVFAIWPNETATELPVGDSSPADVRAADGSARAQ